jgi:hypothetical protein
MSDTPKTVVRRTTCRLSSSVLVSWTYYFEVCRRSLSHSFLPLFCRIRTLLIFPHDLLIIAITMRQVGSVLWPRLRTVQIYGANTGVGKTVISTLLCKALRRRLPDHSVHYLKPISTGPLDDQDNRYASLSTRLPRASNDGL